MENIFNIIVMVNDWDVCRQCVQASLYYLEHHQAFSFYQNNSSASIAYNRGMRETDADYLVFAHQDVYFPAGWFSSVAHTISELNEKDPKWAVLGIIGVNEYGTIQGRTWSTGLMSEVGCFLPSLTQVRSIDELAIILNRNSDILFDEQLPGFHLYGTDIVQIAYSKGLSAYAIDAPVIHNSLPVVKLDQSFMHAYHYLQKKWRSALPIKTTVTTITRYGWPLRKRLITQCLKKGDRSNYYRLDNPAAKARELGYE